MEDAPDTQDQMAGGLPGTGRAARVRPVAAHLACGWTNVNRAGLPLLRCGAVLCRGMSMESEHFQRALRRLEAAVERLERAARPSSSVSSPSTGDDARLVALEARHRKLRDGATQALARLDRLIEEKS